MNSQTTRWEPNQITHPHLYVAPPSSPVLPPPGFNPGDVGSSRGVNFEIWRAGRLKGAPPYKSISRLPACCWCGRVLQPAIEQGGSFLRSEQTDPRSESRGGIPLMSITFDPGDSLRCWYDLSFGFVFPCQNHPGLSTLGVCARLRTLQSVRRSKNLRVGNNSGSLFFFYFFCTFYWNP